MRRNSAEKLSDVREFVKANAEVITRALEQGYSWKQITMACVLESDAFNGVYMRKDNNLIATLYWEMMSSQKKAPKVPTPKRCY